jgi:hypothetical protein
MMPKDITVDNLLEQRVLPPDPEKEQPFGATIQSVLQNEEKFYEIIC